MSKVTEAIELLEGSGYWYFLAKGKVTEDEPLYGVSVYPAEVGDEDNTLATTEHECPLQCARMALAIAHAAQGGDR